MVKKNTKTISVGYCFDIILVFMLIFGIDFPIGINSTFVSFAVLIILSITNIKIIMAIGNLLKNKYFLKVLLLYFVLIIFVFLGTSFHHAYDYSLIKTILNTIVNFIFCGLLCCYLLIKGYTLKDMLKLLLVVFVVQSVIEICALLSPAVLSFVQSFHSNSYVVEKLTMYGARKGLALSGSIFFALSAVFGLMFMFYGRYLILDGKSNYNLVLGVLLAFGAILSGRTSFVGIFFGLLVILFLKEGSVKLRLLPVWLRGGITILFIILLSTVFLSDAMKENLWNLSQYFFEFVYSYLESGTLQTTSTDGMFKMYFMPEVTTLIMGDGYYEGVNGAGYYMETDIGYMRNILFFGLLGLAYLMYIQYFILFKYKTELSKNEFIFSVLVFLYILVVHGKGEMLVYTIMVHRVLFIYFIFSAIYNLDGNKKFY